MMMISNHFYFFCRQSAAAVKEARAKDAKEKESGLVAGPSVVVTDPALERSWNLIRACVGIYYLTVGDYKQAADLFVSLNSESCDFPEVCVFHRQLKQKQNFLHNRRLVSFIFLFDLLIDLLGKNGKT